MTKESTKERTQCCHLFALCLGIGVAHGAKAFLGSELKVVFMRRGMVESVGSFPAQTQSAGGWQSSSAMLRNFCCPLKHRNANKHVSADFLAPLLFDLFFFFFALFSWDNKAQLSARELCW